MSWQATLWAAHLPHSRVGHVPFRVLMLLADHAHDDGTASYRSVASMAATLGVSQRTVQRAIKDLLNERLIERGDQRLLQHLPPNRRPVVYNLLITRAVAMQPELPAGVTGMSPQLSTGVTTDVVSIEEEPPFNQSSSQRNHRARVTPVDIPRCAAGHPLIDERHCSHGCPPLVVDEAVAS